VRRAMSVTPVRLSLAPIVIAGPRRGGARCVGGALSGRPVPPLEGRRREFVALVFRPTSTATSRDGMGGVAGFSSARCRAFLCASSWGARPLIGRALAPAADALATGRNHSCR